MRKFAQFTIRGYKQWLSPVLPVACRYVPTCSEYAEEAIERYGVVRGSAMAVWRLLRCNPFGGSGYDPVVKNENCESRCCCQPTKS
jgi:putative membrane protein insertion efficiency factor